MTTWLNVKNNAESALASAITAAATSLTLVSGEGSKFPSSNFHITIDDEILKCSSRSGDVLTVTRAQEGTTAATHAAGAIVALNVTAGIITQLQDHGALRGWSLVTDQLLTAAATSITISGLDINTDKVYLLLLNFKNDTGSNSGYNLTREGYDTLSNYYTEFINADGASLSSSLANTSVVHFATAGKGVASVVFIFRDVEGYMHAFSFFDYDRGSSMKISIRFVSSVNTTSNITSLKINATVANAIGNGSNLILLKKGA